MLRVILFDLDGTLVETAAEMTDALNHTLQRRGHAAVPVDLVRSWIGDGARALLAKALAHVGEPASALATAWPAFADDYAAHCGCNSLVHAGVHPMLQRLRAQGLRQVLLTNKEALFAQRVLLRHQLLDAFDLVLAGDTLPVKKPHPGVVQHVLARLHATPDQALLVGDSRTDVRTARAAGIAVQLVRHGYPQGSLSGADAPDAFIDHFDQFNPLAATHLANGCAPPTRRHPCP